MGLWLVAICVLVGQDDAVVPPPPPTSSLPSEDLRGRWLEIVRGERDELLAIAAQTDDVPQRLAVERECRQLDLDLGDILYIRPLPEAQRAGGQAFASVPITAAATLPEPAVKRRSQTATELFSLAQEAAAPGVERFGLATRCLRGVIERDADHAEARRLLGFVRYDNGWATPQAAANLEHGMVLHPTFGWVDQAWVANLENGQLPGIASPGRPLPWLPADEADRLRSNFFERPWHIETEHFSIATDVPLSEAIALGRRLEAFYEVFFLVMADAIDSDRLPLAQRYRDPERWASADNGTPRHQVWYLARQDDYIDYARTKLGRDESQSLGYFVEPAIARRARIAPRSYFYRDLAQPLDALATLFHEVSHQVLFETAGPTLYDRNQGQYWIWEGLGTYFEGLRPQEDGSYELGRLAGPRIEKARQDLRLRGHVIPLSDFLALGSNSFQNEQTIHGHYAQAMALTTFLMHADEGRFRAGFLDYVRDAYHGRYRPGSTTPRLPERLGVATDAIETQLEAALRESSAGP